MYRRCCCRVLIVVPAPLRGYIDRRCQLHFWCAILMPGRARQRCYSNRFRYTTPSPLVRAPAPPAASSDQDARALGGRMKDLDSNDRRARGAPRRRRATGDTADTRSAAGRWHGYAIWHASSCARWRKSSRLDVQLGPGGSRVLERARRQTTHRKTERARERERTTDSQTERERQRDRERETERQRETESRDRETETERDRETESHSKDVCACARARQAAAREGGERSERSHL